MIMIDRNVAIRELARVVHEAAGGDFAFAYGVALRFFNSRHGDATEVEEVELENEKEIIKQEEEKNKNRPVILGTMGLVLPLRDND